MRPFSLIAVCMLWCSPSAFAQEEAFDADELLGFAQEFIEENGAVLDFLGVDVEVANKLVNDLQTQFQGTYVYDLSASRDAARELLPILQQFEETQDYAAWLQSRLDYFDVAEQLQKQATVGKTNVTRLPSPTPQTQRRAWVTVVEQRPVPAVANKYILPLKKIFTEERVPPQLVWVAEVESSFNPKARSPAGAVGLFQLMPATARSLDLSVGVLRDERTNPEKSGRAAAKYLRYLHDRFADWRLALAAYNAGEGRVGGLLKRHNAKTFDEIAHWLPSETQMYVPKVEALVKKREGMNLADLRSQTRTNRD
ncbi:MAG: lytic transglycosylase domain-containing protein [Verrucomicrobia bacterium]|nr:lytic transglycosylase domain-containing protein [Verrucomicrobiota bacterium]